jgi:hypothetical protein
MKFRPTWLKAILALFCLAFIILATQMEGWGW